MVGLFTRNAKFVYDKCVLSEQKHNRENFFRIKDPEPGSKPDCLHVEKQELEVEQEQTAASG